MSREKQIMLNVFELYKDMPYLWDKNNKNYKNKTVRIEGYSVLLNLFKSFDESATLKSLKKKIDNYKTNYAKELKKVKESKHTGAGDKDIYVPKLWYYDSLSFLESTTESCRSVKDTIENEDSSLSCSEDSQTTTVTNNSSNKKIFKRKKKEGPLKQQRDILEKASNLMNVKEEDWEILGRSIGMQLRDLDKRQLTIARKLISDVIYYATLNNLSEQSFVCVSNTNQAASLYSSFTPSRSLSSQSEFHPVHTSSSPQDSTLPYHSTHSSHLPFQHQTQSPHPSTSKQYNIISPESPLPTLSFQHQTQSPHPSTSKQYNIQSPESPLPTLPFQHLTQSPHPSTSKQYNIQSPESPLPTLSFQHQTQSPYPSTSKQYNIQSPESPLSTLPFQHQTQSPHPSTSKQYNIQSPESPLPTIPFQHQIQSPHPSTSNSSTVQYTVKVPHPSNPSPQQSVELHIPSPPPQSSTPNQFKTDDSVLIIEGKADIMKEFLIFSNKKK